MSREQKLEEALRLAAQSAGFQYMTDETRYKIDVAISVPKAESAEPIAEAGAMPGTSGFTMACFRAEDVPIGTPLYTSPVPALAAGEEASGVKVNPLEWLWYGEDEEGKTHVSFGRWSSHPCQSRYKLAEIQATEHDHPVPAITDEAKRIAEVIEEESTGGACCGWIPCSGCRETSEGAETGFYPFSKTFQCYVGGGCHECGGLGVVWQHYSKRVLRLMEAEPVTAPAAGEEAGGVKRNLIRRLEKLLFTAVQHATGHGNSSSDADFAVRTLEVAIEHIRSSSRTPSPIVDDAMLDRASWAEAYYRNRPRHIWLSEILNAALSGAREGGE